MTTDRGAPDLQATPSLLDAVLNLSRFHREHEKFYACAPREVAVRLQRHARALEALADRWSTTEPSTRRVISPFEGAEDLNADAALQLDGVLFMEGEGRPAELGQLVRDLRTTADDFAGTGEWLASAMGASWDAAAALVDVEGLEDVLGERHRIIANDWLAAEMSALVARLLRRAAEILERVDFAPDALRDDLKGGRRAPGLVYSAAELLNRGADLCSDSAGLVNDNERRWRVFRRSVAEVVDGHRAREAAGPESTRASSGSDQGHTPEHVLGVQQPPAC
jgi:hypothetical protein